MFPLEVVGYCALDQQRLHLVGQHAKGRGLAQWQRKAVGEQQLLGGHVFHHMPVQVGKPRFLAQVVFGLQGDGGGLARRGLVVQVGRALPERAGHLGQQPRLPQIGGGAHRVHRNAFDQPLAKRLQAV